MIVLIKVGGRGPLLTGGGVNADNVPYVGLLRIFANTEYRLFDEIEPKWLQSQEVSQLNLIYAWNFHIMT